MNLTFATRSNFLNSASNMARARSMVIAVSVATVCALPAPALALPTLSEFTALKPGPALTLYPDNSDSNKFYYMPNLTRTGRDARGIPTFSFTYYGLNSPHANDDAGALLVYVGRLNSDPEQTEAIAQFRRSRPGASLAVLPFSASTLSLTAEDGTFSSSAPYFAESNFPIHSGQPNDDFGLNVVLTATGARIFRDALNGAVGSDTKLEMCYKAAGEGPSVDADISVNLNRVYDHFAALNKPGKHWWHSMIASEVQKLLSTQDIALKMSRGNATHNEIIQRISHLVVARLFKPNPVANSGGAWEKLTPYSLDTTYVRKTLAETENWSLKPVEFEVHEFCAPISLKELQQFKNQCVIDADKN